jgi:hypothetical protein
MYAPKDNAVIQVPRKRLIFSNFICLPCDRQASYRNPTTAGTTKEQRKSEAPVEERLHLRRLAQSQAVSRCLRLPAKWMVASLWANTGASPGKSFRQVQAAS